MDAEMKQAMTPERLEEIRKTSQLFTVQPTRGDIAELFELIDSQQKYIEVLETYWGIPDRVNEYNNPVTFAARKKIQEALKE